MARDQNESVAHKSDRQLLEEIAGRSRRTETKVTMIGDQVGVAETGSKPTYDRDKKIVWVKTPKVSLEDIIEAVDGEYLVVQVFCGEKFLATVCPA